MLFFFSFPNFLRSISIFSISEARAIYVVYFPSSRTIFVVVVNPFQNKELSVQVLERLFREACQALSIQVPISREEISFKVILLVSSCLHAFVLYLLSLMMSAFIQIEYVGHVKDAELNIQRTIDDYRFSSYLYI